MAADPILELPNAFDVQELLTDNAEVRASIVIEPPKPVKGKEILPLKWKQQYLKPMPYMDGEGGFGEVSEIKQFNMWAVDYTPSPDDMTALRALDGHIAGVLKESGERKITGYAYQGLTTNGGTSVRLSLAGKGECLIEDTEANPEEEGGISGKRSWRVALELSHLSVDKEKKQVILRSKAKFIQFDRNTDAPKVDEAAKFRRPPPSDQDPALKRQRVA